MRQVPKTAAPHQRVRYGLYVERQLRIAGFAEWAAMVLAATMLVRERSRAWEDEDAQAYSASGDRDRSDFRLDNGTGDGRVGLAGRSKNANKEKPYILVFPDGAAWYTNAPQNEQVTRYTLLSERLRTFLPEEDPVRALADEIDAGIVAYKAGVEVIAKANLKLSMAAQQLAEAEAAFDATMEKVFGLLVAHFESRAVAGSYFPA
jgi:hypothetical protein